MTCTAAREEFAKGLTALQHDHLYLAMTCFEQAMLLDRTPECCSYLAYCMAKARNDYDEASTLAREALHLEPSNPLHYLHLGRILLMDRRRQEALEVLRSGIPYDRSGDIIIELERLGRRTPPVFSYLKREHPLNKYSGLILNRLGLR